MNKNGMFEQDLWIIPNVNIGEVRTFPLHYHKHVEFLYILDGETDMDIGARSYTVKKGDIVLVAPYILHSYTCNSYCLRCITVFEPEAFGFFGDFLVNNHPVCPIISSDRVRELVPDIEEILHSAYKRCHVSPHHEPKKMTSVIADLYGIYARLIPDIEFENSEDMYDDTYMAALRLCCDNFIAEDFSTDKIAETLLVSRSTIQKLFSKNMGMGVKEYINFLRIGNAQSLLHDTDLPISDIALSSGFGTIHSFNRAFLRIRGCTPGEYRERAIGWTGRQTKKKVSDET